MSSHTFLIILSLTGGLSRKIVTICAFLKISRFTLGLTKKRIINSEWGLWVTFGHRKKRIQFMSLFLCLLQEVEKQHLPTPSAQRAWWTPWVGHAVRASSPPVGAVGRLVQETFQETGCGVAAATTSTTVTVSPGSSWTLVSARRPTHEDPSTKRALLWTYRTMKLGEWWAMENTHKDLLTYRVLVSCKSPLCLR